MKTSGHFFLKVRLLGLCCAWSISAAAGPAAEFDLNGPTLEMRRVQFCHKCRRGLVVTTVPPGAHIKCPNCDTVQRRIPTRYLLTKVFQVCPHCGTRLNVSAFKPRSRIHCGTCGLNQYVLRDAVYHPQPGAGTGWLPSGPRVSGEAPETREARAPEPTAKMQGPRMLSKRMPALAGPELEPPGVVRFSARPIAPSRVPVSARSAAEPDEVAAAIVPPGIPQLPRRLKERSTGMPPANFHGQDGRATSFEIPISEREARLRRARKIDAPLVPLAGDDPDEVLPVKPEDFGAGPVAVATAKMRVTKVEPPPDLGVAARVDGWPIPVADLELALSKAMEQERLRLGRARFTQKGVELLQRRELELRQKVLHNLIDRQLVLNQARREGVMPPREEVLRNAHRLRRRRQAGQAPAALLAQARLQLALKEMYRRHARARQEIRREAVREFYRKHQRRFMQPHRAALEEIIIFRNRAHRRSRRPAAEIAAKLLRQTRLAAASDFPKFVARYSEMPRTAPDGRYEVEADKLQPVALLAEPVRQAIAAARSGDIVGPIELASAVAVCRVVELRKPEPRPLAEVREAIRTHLRQQAQDQAFAAWLASVRQQARIEIY